MAEVVEGSTVEQIKAIEGWALQCYQESVKKSPNIDEIIENLRKINLQARKMEWKGIRGLSKMVNTLRELIMLKATSLNMEILRRRKRGQIVFDEKEINVLEDMKFEADNLKRGSEDLIKKIMQLRAAVVTLRTIKKDRGLSDASKLNIRTLSSLATEARGLSGVVDYYKNLNSRFTALSK